MFPVIPTGIQLYRHHLFVQSRKEEQEGELAAPQPAPRPAPGPRPPAGPQNPCRLPRSQQPCSYSSGPSQDLGHLPKGLTSPSAQAMACPEPMAGRRSMESTWPAVQGSSGLRPPAQAPKLVLVSTGPSGPLGFSTGCARPHVAAPGRCSVPADQHTLLLPLVSLAALPRVYHSSTF